MPAIITSPFRVQNAQRLVSVASSVSERLYITVGKSDDWASSDTVIDTPTTSVKNLGETTGNIIAMKKVASADASLAIPMVKFSQVAFKEYDPSSDTNFIAGTVGGVSCLPAYCVVQAGNIYSVYKCLSNLKNSAGVIQPPSVATAPSTTDYTTPESIGGYLWAYMFQVNSTSNNTFSASFVPVPSAVNTSPDITSNKGKVYGYKVLSGGTGYTNGTYTNIAVVGDGSGAAATVTVAGGIVVKAEVYTTPTPQYGANYTRATLTLTGAGTPSVVAVIQPLLTPINGHGYDPANELGAYYGVFRVAFGPGAEDTDLPAVNDFRQVGLLLNPLDNSSAAITSTYAEAQKTLVFSGLTGTQPLDGILYQPSTGAKAFIDSVSGSSIRYHQNYSSLVNFKAFTTGSIVYLYAANAVPADGIGTGSVGNGTLSSITASEYKPESGQLLFVENRQKITRTDAQTEDVKIIIQF